MARVWIYDRLNTVDYQEAARRAKRKGRKPPARWRVMYYDRAGKLRSEVSPTSTAAKDRRTELEASLKSGTYIDPVDANVSLGEMAEKWLESRHDLKPSTWWKYRGLLDNHVLPRWGELPLPAIQREDIAVWVAKLLKSKDDGGSGLGPSQARHAYRVLAMVLDWCVPARLAVNPARGVKLPVQPEAEHVYLSYQQVELLADAAGSLRTKYDRPTACAAINRALILLLAYTGLRWGEAAALRVGKVDLDKRRIRVSVTFYEVNGVQHEGLPKNGKRRTVSIPAFLVPVLLPLIEDRDPNELVFTTARGQSLRANNWRVREFNAAVEAAELDLAGLTPHKLRHTAASLAIAAGADVKVLQLMLGHADAAMTLNIYGHLFPDRLDEVADVLDTQRSLALAA
ncbi:site-specific integrase [Amycolatopsis sp. 195334CR]|uniref:tyrosine-type recombinase/integrase n=1 Tax=Amycolatopsis sp. 195334CR TaxID=2814588 RepID=UPI001A8D4177|nr:site-specific integrase [Amycolatopsis sp. 195334CR]MBN6039129.1 tyrosine-type recombinase/integrase [Amycolatopsis sp. 195334CR]